MKNYKLMINNLSRKNKKRRKLFNEKIKMRKYFISLDYSLYKNMT